MPTKQWVIIAALIMAMAGGSFSAANAAQKFNLKKSPAIQSTTPVPAARPDLEVETPAWSAPPKEGDAVGYASILNFVVANKGKAAAGPSQVRVACTSLSGSQCPASLSGTLAAVPLDHGKSMGYAWPPASAEKWEPGQYKVDITVDYLNQVQETSETNNAASLIFTVARKIVPIKKMQLKPVPKVKINTDLEVVSITMTPTNPVAGEVVKFVAVAKNSGKMQTPQVEALFSFWDTQGGGPAGQFTVPTPPVPSLLPGQTHTLEVSTAFVTMGDQVGVSLKIDRFDKLKEINEDNNEKRDFFQVQCKPELALYDYTKPKPANISVVGNPGEQVQLTVWVYNNAWCFSKAAKLSVSGDGIMPMLINIPPINPHQRVGLPITLSWETPGIRYGTLKVDATNTNDESIEGNNEMPLMVSVLAPWPTTD